MPLSIGQILNNRYRIVKLIGQGGFGAVYRAWDLSLKQPCALKENLDASPEAQRQFEHEATILAGLRHTNLPRVTDYFFLPGQGQYLVMDFIAGYNLVAAVQLNGGPLPEEQALDWIGQVCTALTYLHNQNPPIIHRDIKPQNIIITPGGQAMLVDFGISKIYDPILSTTGGARGVTPGFSPPEQYGRARTDPRSDLYSISATLYYLLTAHEPPDAIERMVHGAPLTPPRQYNPNITPATEKALLRCLETDSQQRFGSIREFQQALATPPVTPPKVHFESPGYYASTQVISPPAAAVPHIRVLTPAMPTTGTPDHSEHALQSPSKRPGGITASATFIILFGLILIVFLTSYIITGSTPDLLFRILVGMFVIFEGMSSELSAIIVSIIIGVFAVATGTMMLLGKNRGRTFSLVFLGFLSGTYFYYIARYRGISLDHNYSPLVFYTSISLFFYLFRPPVLDYFLPTGAPHPTDPDKALSIIGRLHIVLGFWLLLPILIGTGMLIRRSRDMWWSAYITTSLLCLILFAAIIASLFGLPGLSTIMQGVLLLIFAVEFQVWLYLRRPEVRQLYP